MNDIKTFVVVVVRCWCPTRRRTSQVCLLEDWFAADFIVGVLRRAFTDKTSFLTLVIRFLFSIVVLK